MERFGWTDGEARVMEEELLLVARARSGDRGAYDSLVARHYARVHATAFHLLGNHEDAEDLAQDCFVRAFAALRWYRGDGELGGWLRRIVVHLAHDRLRRRGRRPLRDPLEPDERHSPQPPPEQGASARETGLLVARAVAALPATLQVALVLRTRAGLGYDEIASLSGVTAATVRTRVMKARKLLLRALQGHLGEDVR